MSRIIVIEKDGSANTIVPFHIFEDMGRLSKAWTVLLFIKQLRRRTTELAFLPTFSMPNLIALSQSKHGMKIAN
jgi:hypothetical protein